MYYEIHGSGEPLVLLHGGVGAIEMFGEVLALLAEGRWVVAVDLQAHGRTADIDRPLSFEAMADDIAALIEHLGLERADVMGYSLGAGVALQTAIRHPDMVRKLVVVSTPFKRDGWYPEVLAGMGQMGPEAAEPMKQSPMYQLYASVAPKPEDWAVLLTKLGELLRQDYDWSEDVVAIEAPTMTPFSILVWSLRCRNLGAHMQLAAVMAIVAGDAAPRSSEIGDAAHEPDPRASGQEGAARDRTEVRRRHEGTAPRPLLARDLHLPCRAPDRAGPAQPTPGGEGRGDEVTVLPATSTAARTPSASPVRRRSK